MRCYQLEAAAGARLRLCMVNFTTGYDPGTSFPPIAAGTQHDAITLRASHLVFLNNFCCTFTTIAVALGANNRRSGPVSSSFTFPQTQLALLFCGFQLPLSMPAMIFSSRLQFQRKSISDGLSYLGFSFGINNQFALFIEIN